MILRILSTITLTLAITWLIFAGVAMTIVYLTNLDMVAQLTATINGE